MTSDQVSVRSVDDFRADLKAGQEYEDFVAQQLWNRGLPVYVYRSRRWQWKAGESVNGIEIKLDRRFRETGNLFIETAERRTTDGTSQWRPSGIYDEHDPRILAIGDYRTIYLLGVRLVRYACSSSKRFTEMERGTVRGYLLPVAMADTWAIDVIEVPAPEPVVAESYQDDDIPF